MMKADLTQKVINPDDFDYPRSLRCKSGHIADEFMERDGVIQRMRFIHVSGEALPAQHHGTYCEKCIILANKMAKSQRNLNKY